MPTTRAPARWKKPLLIGVGALVVIVLIAAIIHGFLARSGAPRKPTLQQIALLKPPPPPPPKPEQKPPEPEVRKQEVKLPEPPPEEAPKAARDEAPAGKDLGVDAEGGAGSDGFGLVGRKGGRDLLADSKPGGTLLGGGGGARARFGFYTTLIQQQLQEALARNSKLRSGDYRAIVNIWLARDGRITRFELTGSTGNSETDALLKLSLTDMPAFKSPPPDDMPQPVRLAITSRGAG